MSHIRWIGVVIITAAVVVSPVVAMTGVPFDASSPTGDPPTHSAAADAGEHTRSSQLQDGDAAQAQDSADSSLVDIDPADLPGEGTPDDPYIITNTSELQAMEDDLEAAYRLGADINASETVGWHGVAGFDPIGEAPFDDDTGPPFNGTFDGAGYTITGLHVNRSTSDNIGVFGYLGDSGRISSVTLTDVTVNGSSNVGGLIGENEGTVSNGTASGAVTGSTNVGGLVGLNDGGFWGFFQGMVRNAAASGAVTGSNNVGGLIGRNGGTVRNGTASGDITGSNGVGGLIGNNRPGTVSNSHYNISKVEINGENRITIGALFPEQFQDWETDNDLNISAYSSINRTASGVEITTVQGIKDALGFTQNPALDWTLGDDINMSEERVDLYVPYLAGDLDGNGHTLTVDINHRTTYDVGAIGYNGGKITDLSVTGIVNGSRNVGGLVGENRGTVRNVSASGVINGSRNVGGLVGENGAGGFSFSEGTVRNGTASGDISGSDFVGGLVGKNGGPVRNVSASGAVTGSRNVGGLVGDNGGTVSNASASGAVNGSSEVGGLIGNNGFNRVRNVFATGSVAGRGTVGGLIGSNYGTIKDAFATGAVTGSRNVGGLVGDNNGTVRNGSASGAVAGLFNVGGLIGKNAPTVSGTVGIVKSGSASGAVTGARSVGGLVGQNEGTVRNTFATGDVTGTVEVGGLVGADGNGSVTESYWNINTTGQSTSGGGTGLTTAQMTGDAARRNMPRFAFGTVWQTRPGGYPVLKTQPTDPITPPQAFFNLSSSSPEVGTTVTFDASNATDADGTITLYEWDLTGDGTVDATGAEVTRTYQSSGAFQITLTVIDDDGSQSQEQIELTVQPNQTASPETSTDATQGPDDTETEGPGQPGFGIGTAIAGLGGAGYILTRRLNATGDEQ